MFKFLQKFWKITPPQENLKSEVLAAKLSIKAEPTPYVFNEFEEFIIKNIKDGRYEPIEKLLKKDFQIGVELKQKMYELFWVDFSSKIMTYSTKISKKSELESGAWNDYLKFLVRNKIFDMDFLDVLENNDIHLRDNVKAKLPIFKKALKQNRSLAKAYNSHIHYEFGLNVLTSKKQVNITDSFSGALSVDMLGLSDEEKDGMALHINNFLKVEQRTTLHNEYTPGTNIYLGNLLLSRNKLNDKDKLKQLENGLFSFNSMKHFILDMPFMDLLENKEKVDINEIEIFKSLKESYTDTFMQSLRDRNVDGDEARAKLGYAVSNFLHLSITRDQVVMFSFFPYLIKTLVEDKGVSPGELFKNIIKRDGDISDLSLFVLQEYPNEVKREINQEFGPLLLKKISDWVEVTKFSLERQETIHRGSRHTPVEETKEFIELVSNDRLYLKNIINEHNDNQNFARFESSKSEISISQGDFVRFAKIKEFPDVIILKLEHIQKNIEILKDVELDIESNQFFVKAKENVFGILHTYASLEELSETISSEDIEKILIKPLMDLDKGLETISNSHQEKMIAELSRGKVSMGLKVKAI